MRGHEAALQKALVAHLRSDANVRVALGDPARIWDGRREPAEFPHLLIERSESRPLRADVRAMEQRLTLTIVSRTKASEQAKIVLAAVRGSLADARPQADEIRTVSLSIISAQVEISRDGARTYATLRLRAVTEEV